MLPLNPHISICVPLHFLLILGIMAILFCGIVMSHYAHFNLSPVTQITVQQLFRTAAFVAGNLFISLAVYASFCCFCSYAD